MTGTIKPDSPNLKLVWGQRSATHLKGHLQDILGDLHDARVSQLPGDAHPGVGGGHGVAQLLDGVDGHTVRDHCHGRTTAGVRRWLTGAISS